MQKKRKKEGELKKLKYSKAKRRKRDSNETRISLPEFCIKTKIFDRNNIHNQISIPPECRTPSKLDPETTLQLQHHLTQNLNTHLSTESP